MKIERLFHHIEKTGIGSRKILEGVKTLTYGELILSCRKLHNFLQSSGMRPGDRIAVASADDIHVTTFILACFRSGYQLLILDVGAKKSEAQALLNKASIRAIFVDEEPASEWFGENGITHSIEFIWTIASKKKKLISRLLGKKETEKPKDVKYPECLEAIDAAGNENLASEETNGSAILLCTSGTTGLPKILKLSYDNLASAALTQSAQLRLNEEMKLLDLLPLTHYDGIMSGIFVTFLNCATLIRVGQFSVQLIPDIFDAIYKYRVTNLLLTPSIMALMLRLGEDLKQTINTKELKGIMSTAATLPPKLWSDFEEKSGQRVVNVYGLSETGNCIFAGPDDESHIIGAIGKPVNCRVLIVNDQGEKLPNDEVGEVLIFSESITDGYLDQPAPIASIEGVEWFQTGDLGYYDRDGVYWLVGRKKNIIIVGGRNIYPDEINNVLLSHPSVMDAATIGLPDDIWEEQVVSCVVTRDGASSADLMKFCSMKLTDYKVPRQILVMPELPKGRSGKVIVNELISRIEESKNKQPGGTTEQKLEQEVLSLASDSFRVAVDELSPASNPQTCSGWDSLAHMNFVLSMEKKFGIEFLPREIIEITNIAAAVNMIRGKLSP